MSATNRNGAAFRQDTLRYFCPKSPISIAIYFFLLCGVWLFPHPALAQSYFSKTINVYRDTPYLAVTTWFYNDCVATLTGAYTIDTAPTNGSLSFADANLPIPNCSTGPQPAALAYYTWTNTSPSVTTDFFELTYSCSGQYEIIDVTVNLVPAPPIMIITPSTLPDATAHEPYQTDLTAIGGEGEITWSLGCCQTLPAGFTLFSNGLLASSGFPTATPRTYTFNVVATDSAGTIAQTSFTLIVLGEGQGLSAKPPTSISWYINARKRRESDAALYLWMFIEGFEAGQSEVASGSQDSVAILDFGTPAIRNGLAGAYGNTPFPRFLSTTTIAEAVEQFALGFYGGTYSTNTAQMRIVVGVNNYGSFVTNEHGEAWLLMVQAIGATLSTYGDQVTVRGGSDMELAYSGPATTYDWVTGYSNAQAFPYFLYDFGDAQSCPQVDTTSNPGSCINGWSQDSVSYISWEAPLSYPFPEIYGQGGGNARQWQQLSLYSALESGGNMFILGPLTQHYACQQRPGASCRGTNNSPSEAWLQLSGDLDSQPQTSQDMIWSTDIRWRNP